MAAARVRGDASHSAIRRALAAALVVGALLTPAAVASATPRLGGSGVAVSVVVPIIAPGDAALLDAAALEIAMSPAGVLTRELDEVLATRATIALDPRIPVSIRALGTTAPTAASAWLDRLESAPNEVFLLAYADADLTALARTDALDLATPLGFGFALDPAAFGPAETAAPTATPVPTPTPDADAVPPLPDTDDLLAWPEAIARIAWPSEGSASAEDLAAYSAAGYDATLVSSANVSETATAHVDVGGVAALVADSAASDLFRQATASIDTATRDAAIERLGLALDGLAAAEPGRSVVLTLDRTASFGFPSLDEVIAAIGSRASTDIVGLSAVLASAPAPASVVAPTTPPHVERASALVDAVRTESSFATILSDPLLLLAPRQLELLGLLGVGTVADEDWNARTDAYLDRSLEILGSVTIVDTGDVFVSSSTTTIPIRVANALDFPVTVRIDVRALRPLLRVDGPVDITIEPGSSKTERLGAQAITNGTVVVEVSLSSPSTGVGIGAPRRFNADLQAQWETVGLIVGALVAVVFAVGIVRNVVVRRRRAARERDADRATG